MLMKKKMIFLMVTLLFLAGFATIPIFAEGTAEGTMPGRAILDGTLNIEQKALLTNGKIDLSNSTVEIHTLIVHTIEGDTFEVELTQYTRRDGTQPPTGDWDFNVGSLTNVNQFSAQDADINGTLECENLHIYGTIEVGEHSGRAWYQDGKLWFSDDYEEINITDIVAAIEAKSDKVTGAITGNFAGLDAEGNLTDSGKSQADYYTSSEINLIFITAKEAHRVLYVRKDGNDSNSGSEINPLLTISEAYSVAETMSPTLNDPIVIDILGEFTEQVTVDMAGIHFIGHGQGVSQWKYAGNTLIITDNGVDTAPWDMKVKGISFHSTDTGEYAVKIQGIAGTSLGGNELQFMDCRFDSPKGIHINLANYIDFQNTYGQGSALYEQVCGIWYEGSESAGNITNDWDDAGLKPSGGSHYGVNFVQHLPRGSLTLLHDGTLGEDYVPREMDDTVIDISKLWSSNKIKTELQAQDAASEIENDSSVSGSSVADALDNLLGDINEIGSVFDLMKMKSDRLDGITADVVLTSTGSGDLQIAISSLSEGQVLEIKTNAIYTPITISTNNITIKAATGYCPKITGQYGITLSDGLSDVIIADLILDSCSTGNSNYMGACVTFGSQGSQVYDIIFKNITFSNVVSGSAVMLSYHGFTDAYYTDIYDSECSERIAFIDCCFNDAGVEGTEGASLCLRATKYGFVFHSKFDGVHRTSRGVLLQGIQNCMVQYNRFENLYGNGEAIKVDEIGTAQFVNTAIVRENYIREAIQGVDIDDECAALVYSNCCWDITNEAFVLDDSQARFVCNTAFNSGTGFHLESGSSAEIKNCVSFTNTTNYLIENGYTLDDSNSEDIRDTLIGYTANNTAYDNATYNNVDKALDHLFSVSVPSYYQTTEVWTSDGSGSYILTNSPDGGVNVILGKAVWQVPGVDFSVAGTTITFIGTPPSLGTVMMFSYIYH